MAMFHSYRLYVTNYQRLFTSSLPFPGWGRGGPFCSGLWVFSTKWLLHSTKWQLHKPCLLQNGVAWHCIDKQLCSTILTSLFQKMMIMYMQSILDKMDALQNGYGFFVLVSRTCFHLIKCLCETDHFVGYSSCNSSHFISYKFCSELAANCLI